MFIDFFDNDPTINYWLRHGYENNTNHDQSATKVLPIMFRQHQP